MAGRFAVSFPGRRGPSDPWFRIGTFDVTTTMVLVLCGVASMLTWALEGPRHRVFLKLMLDPDELPLEFWRVATWPQANDLSNGRGLWFVVMLAILWYFGTEIERLLGRNRFALLLALIIVIPGIVGWLINLPQAGLRPVELCVFLLFVAEYPNVRFMFGIPSWVMGAVILGVEVIQLLGDRNEKGIVFLFVALAVAALTARTMGLLSNFPWIPALPIGNQRSSGTRRPKPARGRGNRSGGGRGGDVVAGPWTSNRGGPTGSAPLPQPPVSDLDMARDQAELDSLLDKISESGMDGLSTDEKRRLNELSKRMRGRR